MVQEKNKFFFWFLGPNCAGKKGHCVGIWLQNCSILHLQWDFFKDVLNGDSEGTRGNQ